MPTSQSLSGLATVLTKGNTTNDNFYPMTNWISTADVLYVRGTVEMRGNTGDCKISPAYQLCNDPDSPDTAVQIGSAYQSGDGITYPSGYDTLSTATIGGRQYIR